ncbi:MAG: hypothetical protein KKB31_00410 [Nanoarchaeota archaeon]|nr:hypothetical protein [Nanoarchaeota archaeon]
MVEVLSMISDIDSFLSGEAGLIFTLLFFTAVIIIYSVFVFYFYRFLAKKNIIELNLHQYNRYSNSNLAKFFAIIFYIVEYLVLLPILTFFWFAVLAILILTLAEGIPLSSVLLISAALVASVRTTAYISESLSKDLAKMIPFTFLAIAFTKPGFFEVSPLLSRILEIPTLLSIIPYYLIFIVSIELIMRFLDFVNKVFVSKEEL